MRQVINYQQEFQFQILKSELGKELGKIEEILSSLPGYKQICKKIYNQIAKENSSHGISAEQVLRAGIVRIRCGFTYRGLSDATNDSNCIRKFLFIGLSSKGFSKSALQNSLSQVSEEIWVKLNQSILSYAKEKQIEDGRVQRVDTTASQVNISYPTDAKLINDSIRVTTRILKKLKKEYELVIIFKDHRRVSKRLLFKINNVKGQDKRVELYKQLFSIASKTYGYVKDFLSALNEISLENEKILKLVQELERIFPLFKGVISQAKRRILKGEAVPVKEKVVSIFEEHTDIIVKGFRKLEFGHKLSVGTGRSGIITHFEVLDGNPADNTLIDTYIDSQKKVYKDFPEELAFDGSYASVENRDKLKEAGCEELTFCKNRKMNLESLCSSKKKHKQLMNFRAGIEACISYLKRIFGLSRVLDRTLPRYRQYCYAASCAYNLTILSRL